MNRNWLIDQLRFYRKQLSLRGFHRDAQTAHDMIDYVLDHGMAWTDCVPAVVIFVTEADRAIQGRRSLPSR